MDDGVWGGGVGWGCIGLCLPLDLWCSKSFLRSMLLLSSSTMKHFEAEQIKLVPNIYSYGALLLAAFMFMSLLF